MAVSFSLCACFLFHNKSSCLWSCFLSFVVQWLAGNNSSLNLSRNTFFLPPAQRFFFRYHGKQESYFSEDLIRLKSITLPEHLVNHELVDAFRFVLHGPCVMCAGRILSGFPPLLKRRDKYTIRISSDSLHPLIKHLQVWIPAVLPSSLLISFH